MQESEKDIKTDINIQNQQATVCAKPEIFIKQSKQSVYFQMKDSAVMAKQSSLILSMFSELSSKQQYALKIQAMQQNRIKQLIKFFQHAAKLHVCLFQASTVNTQISSILNQIKHIKFTNLRDLSLVGNCIISIQKLNHIEFSNLKTIRLDENKIASLKSFRKCRFPCLEQMDLEGNPFSDPEWLRLMDAPLLNVVRLQDWTHLYPTNDNKNWVVQMQTKSLNYIRCPNSLRMKQDIVEAMLKCKYLKLNVMRCKN